MHSEVIDLADCCQEIITIIVMVDDVGADIGLAQSDNSRMHVCIHDDNAVVLVLDQTLLPQFTPSSKHYAVKTK